MSSLDPKDDNKPKASEKQEQKPDTPESQQQNNDISLSGLAPRGRDSLQQVNRSQQNQGSDMLSFSPRIEISNQLGGANSDPMRFSFRSGNEFKRGFSLDLRDQPSQSQNLPQEFRSNWTPSNAEANSGMAFQSGSRQFFRLQKSEFTPTTDDKPLAQLQSLTNKFLTETESKEDRHLSPAERQELTHTRQQLNDAQSPGDVISNALHLARIYQHLRYIDEAKKAADLALGIDPDNPTGKQLFSELERMHPADIGVTSAAIASASLTKSRLRNCIHSLTGGRIIVAGDMLIDELMEGKPERISREAPVLILEHVETQLIPGGAANTAHNIAALGGQCHAIGICGRDEYAGKMAALLESCHITHSLVEDPSRPTTVKTRILSKSHSLMQQLLRLDRISHEPIDETIERALMQRLEQAAPNYKAIVLSDYKAGVITDGIINICRNLAVAHQVLIVVDAQQQFERFKGVTLITPNQPDTEKAVGYPLNSREALIKAGNEILAASGVRALLVTRGAEGMVLFQANQDMVELPAFNRSDVFDVTGAGDTVVGTMALALVTGASFLEAMALGNLAAGIVVRKSGTAVTSQKEMLDNLELLNLPE